MTEPISTSAIVFHGTLAIFGAVVHALSAHRNGTSKSFLDFLILVTISSFTWVMFTLLAFHMFPASIYLTGACAWFGWFVWVEWMSFVSAILKSKFK